MYFAFSGAEGRTTLTAFHAVRRVGSTSGAGRVPHAARVRAATRVKSKGRRRELAAGLFDSRYCVVST